MKVKIIWNGRGGELDSLKQARPNFGPALALPRAWGTWSDMQRRQWLLSRKLNTPFLQKLAQKYGAQRTALTTEDYS